MQTIHSIALLTFCAGALIGCQSPTSDTGRSPQPSSGLCNVEYVEDLIGIQVSPEIQDQARIKSGAAIARVLRPGDIVTLEYNAQRLTISTDETLRVKRVNCG
ncbi:peptidase inhibitor I78 family protein [Stutzerimonas zhaodongensis]|uniref:Peptidase inhibitor I78 family protein n=1 Tax=Stutzerimonas zhaodongensis TaxID=1176257 RepID=A0A3M2HV21_9GAMM|nr:I78 family peptidase inhibitor [Stutzerimonas zhaodongensis]MCQ4314610.1 I78 family peptidase inhibitor [Stutzerimonas zhaodongensis]RMH92125.1 peptidase inhibitor I78 family protein [Stutzerimonas zhaodongensis]